MALDDVREASLAFGTPVAKADGIAASDGWSRLSQSLAALDELTDDWDGDGAEAPLIAIKQSARHLAKAMETAGFPPPLRIVPTVAGCVVFEWQHGGQVAEIEIVQPGRVEGVRHYGDGRFDHLDQSAETNLKKIRQFLFGP